MNLTSILPRRTNAHAATAAMAVAMLSAAIIITGCRSASTPATEAMPAPVAGALPASAVAEAGTSNGVSPLPALAVIQQAPPANAAEVAQLLRQVLARATQLTHYRAIFRKQERMDGQLRPLEVAQLTVREGEPFSVRLTWIGQAERGKDIIFVHGQNKDRMKVYTGNMLLKGPWDVSPTDAVVMKQNRKPITMAGLRNLASVLLRCDDEPGDAPPEEFRDLGLTTYDPGAAAGFQYAGPAPATPQSRQLAPTGPAGSASSLLRLIARPYHAASRFAGHWLVFGIDPLTNLVVLNLHLDHTGDLVAIYHYLQLDLQAPVTDADFDPRTLGKRGN